MSVEISFDMDGSGDGLVHTELDTPAYQITELVTMSKNTDALNPDKGVEINSYFPVTEDAAIISTIKEEISTQISKYTPFVPTDVAVIIKSNMLVIGITLQGYADVICISSDNKRTALDILKDY